MRPTACSRSSCSRSALPAPALAGTFVVPFGGGTPMLAAGWTREGPTRAPCAAYEGTRNGLPERRDAAGPQRLPLPLQRAGGRADPGRQRVARLRQGERRDRALRVLVRCAAGRHAAPLQRAGRSTNAVAASGANWVELGLYNEGATPIALATARANNVVFASGWVTLADPTAPGSPASGPSGRADRPLGRAGLGGLRSRERRARRSPTRSTAARSSALRGQACSWLCGTDAGGSAAIDLGALADGPHSITVYAQSYADAGAQRRPDRVHRRSHRAGAARHPGRAGRRRVGDRLVGTRARRADDLIADGERRGRLDGARLRAVRCARLPGRLCRRRHARRRCPPPRSRRAGAYEVDVLECDAAGHCTASPRAGLHWDGAARQRPSTASPRRSGRSRRATVRT